MQSKANLVKQPCDMPVEVCARYAPSTLPVRKYWHNLHHQTQTADKGVNKMCS